MDLYSRTSPAGLGRPSASPSPPSGAFESRGSLFQFSSSFEKSGKVEVPTTSLEQPEKVETIAHRQAEWDRSDQAQTKLFDYQWKIITEQMSQIAALVDGLAVLRNEVHILKSEHTDKIEAAHNRMRDLASLDHVTTLTERLKFAEKVAAESSEKHASAIQQAHKKLQEVHSTLQEEKDSRGTVHSTMEQRVGYLEKFVGESFDKHAKNLDDANKRMREFHGNSSTLEQRVLYIEKAINDSADRHDRHAQELEVAQKRLQDCHGQIKSEADSREKHTATMQERIDYLERMFGDSAEKHSKEFQMHKQDLATAQAHLDDSFARLAQLDGSLKQERDWRQNVHVTLEQRMVFLEKFVGDSAEKHEKHAQEVDRVTKHVLDVDSRVGAMNGHVTSEKKARDSHQSSIQQRIDYLEKAFGDSADRHKEQEAAHKILNDIHNHTRGEMEATIKRFQDLQSRFTEHTTIPQRVSYLEKAMGDSAEKHEKQMQEAERLQNKLHEVGNRLGEFHGQLLGEKKTRDGHTATVQQRIDFIEKCIGDSADKHKEVEAAHQILQNTHVHAKAEVDAAHKKIQDLHSRLTEYATVPQRLTYLEKSIGDSVEKHDKHIRDFEVLHKSLHDFRGRIGDMSNQVTTEKVARDTHSATIQARVDYLEKCMGDSADKHKDAESASKILQDTLHHSKSELEAAHKRLHESHSGVQERIGYLEKVIGDSAAKHEKHIQDLDMLHKGLQDIGGRLGEFHGQISGEKKTRDGHHNVVIQRLENVEKALGESADRHGDMQLSHQALNDHHSLTKQELEAAHKKIADLHARVSDHHTIPQRVTYLEKFLGESAEKHDRHVKDIEGLGDMVREFHSHVGDLKHQVGGEKQARDSHHASVTQRIDYLEKCVGDSSDRHRELEVAHKKMAEGHGIARNETDVAYRKLHDTHSNMSTRIEYLEKQLGDIADQIRKEMEVAGTKLADLQGRVVDAHSNIQGDREHREKHHQTFEQRLDHLEKLIGEASDRTKKHSGELDNAHKQLKEFFGHVQSERQTREEHTASVQQRLEYIEQFIGDSADKHRKDLEAAHQRLQDVHGNVSKLQEEREKMHATMEQRLTYVESILGDSANKYIGKAELEAIHKNLENVHSVVKSETMARETHHVTLEERIKFLEAKVCDSAGKHAKECELAAQVAMEQLELASRVSGTLKDIRSLDESGTFTPDTVQSRVPTTIVSMAATSLGTSTPAARAPFMPQLGSTGRWGTAPLTHGSIGAIGPSGVSAASPRSHNSPSPRPGGPMWDSVSKLSPLQDDGISEDGFPLARDRGGASGAYPSGALQSGSMQSAPLARSTQSYFSQP